MTQIKTRTRSAPRKPAKIKKSAATQGSDVLILAEAAAYLRVTPEELLHMVTAQGLRGRQFGTEWRFLKTALQDWLGGPQKKSGFLAQLGRTKDDPYLQEMLDEIYARRGRPEVDGGLRVENWLD